MNEYYLACKHDGKYSGRPEAAQTREDRRDHPVSGGRNCGNNHGGYCRLCDLDSDKLHLPKDRLLHCQTQEEGRRPISKVY